MEMKAKIDCVCEIFDTMLSCFKSEISNGLMNVNAKEAGEVADIIKDMSETEKNLYEANYYKLVSEAMEEKNKPENQNRRMGYNWNEKPYIDAYLRDPDFEQNMRMGYIDSNGTVTWGGSENGRMYDEYLTAKRHYTETKSSTDKDMMDMYASNHLNKTIETVKEMWADADQPHKTKMKSELTALVNSLNA